MGLANTSNSRVLHSASTLAKDQRIKECYGLPFLLTATTISWVFGRINQLYDTYPQPHKINCVHLDDRVTCLQPPAWTWYKTALSDQAPVGHIQDHIPYKKPTQLWEGHLAHTGKGLWGWGNGFYKLDQQPTWKFSQICGSLAKKKIACWHACCQSRKRKTFRKPNRNFFSLGLVPRITTKAINCKKAKMLSAFSLNVLIFFIIRISSVSRPVQSVYLQRLERPQKAISEWWKMSATLQF